MPPFHGDRMLAYGNTLTEALPNLTDRQPFEKEFSVRSLTQEFA